MTNIEKYKTDIESIVESEPDINSLFEDSEFSIDMFEYDEETTHTLTIKVVGYNCYIQFLKSFSDCYRIFDPYRTLIKNHYVGMDGWTYWPNEELDDVDDIDNFVEDEWL